MNLKIEKGITFVALIITVILMLILLGVLLHFGTDAIDKAKLEDLKTDMISIKTKAKIIVEQYNFKDIENLVGTQITLEEAQKVGLESTENAYKWTSEDLSNQGLPTIKGDKYIVKYDLSNPNNCEVYTIEGFNENYSLTDLQALEI